MYRADSISIYFRTRVVFVFKHILTDKNVYVFVNRGDLQTNYYGQICVADDLPTPTLGKNKKLMNIQKVHLCT